MGIRDTSYYGWKDVSFAQLGFTPTGMAVDSLKQIYVCGYKTITSGTVWVVAKSPTGQPNTFAFVDYCYNYLSGTSGSLYPTSIALGSDDAVYVTGYEVISSTNIHYQWLTRKSTAGISGTFSTIDTYRTSFDGYNLGFYGSANAPTSIAVSPVDGAVYVAGGDQNNSSWRAWYVRRSSTGTSGSFDGVFSRAGGAGNQEFITQIAVNPVTGIVYAVGSYGHNQVASLIVTSSAGLSGTWGSVDSQTSMNTNGIAFNSTTGVAYTSVSKNSGGSYLCATIRSSSNGTPGTWGEIANFWGGQFSVAGSAGCPSFIGVNIGGVAVSSVSGRVFLVATLTPPGGTTYKLASSGNGASGTYAYTDSYTSNPRWITEKLGRVYICRYDINNNTVYRSGELTSNSASLGPITLATSIGYVQSEISGVLTENFGLANVSEWSHAGGLYQMKNMVIGTLSSGKIGNRDDNIIQVKHIGSTVQIMWPRQQNANASIRGYGDLSIGQSVGKLTTIFDPGDFIDVAEFDHMSLYCYLQKQASGTIDDIVVQVERKPLTNVGFTVEQGISVSTSGSITEVRLRDLQYKKQIDYGDLSIKEIGYPIDVPLTNVKQVRISVKQSNGQADDGNKNLIVYGRFIKSSTTTNET